MKFDLRTITLVHRRLESLAERPRLFFDAMPPARVSLRRQRFRDWCGMSLCEVLRSQGSRDYIPAAGGYSFARSKVKWARRRVGADTTLV